MQSVATDGTLPGGAYQGMAGDGAGGMVNVAGIIGVILIVLGVAIAVGLIVFFIIAWWRIYTKAGRPGWSNLIPVYGWVEFFNVAWGNGVYFLFMLIPGVNILVAILTVQKLSESYGHGLGFTLGLFCFPAIFIPILGFGKSKHVRYQARLAEEAEKQELINAGLKAVAEAQAKAEAEAAAAESAEQAVAEPSAEN